MGSLIIVRKQPLTQEDYRTMIEHVRNHNLLNALAIRYSPPPVVVSVNGR